MKEEIGAIKLFVWCSLLFIWLLLNKLMHYGNATIVIVGISAIAAVIMMMVKIRKYICTAPLRLPLSDNNIAALLFVLGLGSMVGYDDAYYFFLVIVTVVGVAIDTYNRNMEEDG